MKLLVDTNIVIPMEPTRRSDIEANTDLALKLSSIAMRDKHQLYVHPMIVEDLARDRDLERRALRESLIQRYPLLPHPPPREPLEALLRQSIVSPNDAVDNALLAAVHADAVHYLVTEDGGIHRKARRLGLADRVVSISAALDLLRDLYDRTPPPPPFVEAIKAHCLDPADEIFESFRVDYPEFDGWLRRARQDHRDTWIVRRSADRCAAFVIVKPEAGDEIGVSGRVLKLCSFKVAKEANGAKLGELLLKAIFNHARENRYEWIFVTVFSRHQTLVALFRQFGFFEREQATSRGELVMVKALVPNGTILDPLEHHIAFGPGSVLSYDALPGHVVPIKPEYHDALFPDAARQQFLRGFGTPKPYGSAIRKAYLCHASIRRLRPGDNLFFYRSEDEKSIRCTGVVENVLVSCDPEQVAGLVGVRTVYRFDEIEAMTRHRDVLAILFRHDRTLPFPIQLAELRANSVLNGPPQSILSVRADGLRWLGKRMVSQS